MRSRAQNGRGLSRIEGLLSLSGEGKTYAPRHHVLAVRRLPERTHSGQARVTGLAVACKLISTHLLPEGGRDL